MDEEEEFKTKENPEKDEKDLPSIHKKKQNQFFNLDEFNSQENEKDCNGSIKDNTPIDGDDHVDAKVNIMMNTADKLKDCDDKNSHKNGTVSGSDHKLYGKSSDEKGKTKNDDTPFSHSKSLNHDEAVEKHSARHSAENEILHKERKRCPKCPPKVLDFMNKILNNNIYIVFMTIVTLYALFGDDFRLLLSPKSGDPVFWSLTVFALV